MRGDVCLHLPGRRQADLYHTICGLSYTGDVRMGIGENPKKIQNIVSANLAGFRGLYKPLLASVLDGSGKGLSHAYSFLHAR
jgi:hypothetical protein